MEICERKRKILQAIIENYIETAEPVASQTLAKISGLSLSSATIRNELAELEQAGLLEKPHTSAGRIPSASGYRVYVDSLMGRHELSSDEMDTLRSKMELQVDALNSLVEKACEATSRITNYTTIAAAHLRRSDMIASVKLVYVDPCNVIFIVSDGAGVVKTRTVRVGPHACEVQVNSLSESIAKNIVGSAYDDISFSRIRRLCREFPEYAKVVTAFFDFLGECMDAPSQQTVCLGGAVNIFNFPEYNDISRARELLSFIEQRENISTMLRLTTPDSISIAIGDEINVYELRDCGVIVANYTDGRKLRGSVGIIGPMRMNYKRLISSLNCICERINILLANIYFDE